MDKGIEEVIASQLKIVKYLDDHEIGKIGGDELSRMVVALATNNAYLGQLVAKYEYDHDMQEALAKNTEIKEYMALRNGEGKMSQGDAEKFSKDKTEDINKSAIKIKGNLLRIKNLRTDCKELQTAIQSRIGQLKQERMDAMLPNAN